MLKPILCAIAVLASGVPAQAQDVLPNLADIVEVKLIKGWPLANGDHVGAVTITLATGWKTYWRVAGETGLPPVFDWQGSGNLAAVEYHWPRPDIIETDGLQILGFSGQLTLPITFRPENAAKPLALVASLDLGVCRAVCIPVHADLELDPDRQEGAQRLLIDMALADQPRTGADAGLTDAMCQLVKTDDGYHLSARFDLPMLEGRHEIVVFETATPDIWITPSKSHRDGPSLFVETDLLDYANKAASAQPTGIRATIIGQKIAVDVANCLMKS